MQPTSTTRQRQSELEQQLHLNRDEPWLKRVLELVSIYEAQDLATVIRWDHDREIVVGQVRAWQRLREVLTVGKKTYEAVKNQRGITNG